MERHGHETLLQKNANVARYLQDAEAHTYTHRGPLLQLQAAAVSMLCLLRDFLITSCQRNTLTLPPNDHEIQSSMCLLMTIVCNCHFH